MSELNTEIRIRLITDKKELKNKGHDLPVIELYNDIVDVWLSCRNLSFDKLEQSIGYIKKATDTYCEIKESRLKE